MIRRTHCPPSMAVACLQATGTLEAFRYAPDVEGMWMVGDMEPTHRLHHIWPPILERHSLRRCHGSRTAEMRHAINQPPTCHLFIRRGQQRLNGAIRGSVKHTTVAGLRCVLEAW